MKYFLWLTALVATLGLSACGQREEMPPPGSDGQLSGPTQPAGNESSGATQSGSSASEGSN